MKILSQEEVEDLRDKYPVGTKVKLISMDDFQAPPPGTTGEIRGVDDAGDIMVRWSTGSSLNLIPNVDEFEVVERP